jgi:hypothetical protein
MIKKLHLTSVVDLAVLAYSVMISGLLTLVAKVQLSNVFDLRGGRTNLAECSAYKVLRHLGLMSCGQPVAGFSKDLVPTIAVLGRNAMNGVTAGDSCRI